MGQAPNPNENDIAKDLIKIKEETDQAAFNQAAWQSAYTITENVAATSQGRALLQKAFGKEDSATLPGLQLFWAEHNNKIEEYDKDNDGLSPDEIDEILDQAQPNKITASGVDILFLEHLKDNLDLAKADGDGRTISLQDLKLAKEAADAKQKAAKETSITGFRAAETIQSHFKELAKYERIADGKNDLRISEKSLPQRIATLEGMIKREENGAEATKSYEALKNALKHMQKNFSKIKETNNDGGTGVSFKDLEAYKQSCVAESTNKDKSTSPKDTTKWPDANLNPEVAKSVIELLKNVPVTEIDGHTPLQIVDGKAIARYGNNDLGFQFDKNGDLIAVFNNPKDKAVNGAPQSVFEQERVNGKIHCYYRPNGLGNKEGQYELPGAFDVNPKNGNFVRMLSGQMGENHIPKPGSAYESTETRILADGKKLTYQYTVEKSGAAFGYGWRENSLEPFRVIYRPSATAAWESLDRVQDKFGKYTEAYRGNVTCKGGIKVQGYEISKPYMNRHTGVFSYDVHGLRQSHSPLAQNVDDRFGGADIKMMPHNGGSLFYSGEGNNVRAIRYSKTDGNTTRNVYFDKALDAKGQQRKDDRGIPLWIRSESKDATGKPLNPKEVAFKPYVDGRGRFTDTGRDDAPQRPGYITVLDWNTEKYYFVPRQNK